MNKGNLELSPRETALILSGLLELSARLDEAQEAAARGGDIAGLLAIDDSRSAIGGLYDRVRSQHLGPLPSLASDARAAA